VMRVEEGMMAKGALEEYRAYVSNRLSELSSYLQSYAQGDFSKSIEIPEEGDEFAELFMGLDRMAQVFKAALREKRETIARLERAEETLRKAGWEKEIILDSLVEHVIYEDTEMKIAWANQAACESVGLTGDELIGRHCYAVWPKRSQPCPDCPVLKAMKTGKPQEIEKSTPDGRVWFIRGYPVRDEKGDVVGGIEVTLEVTKQVRAEEALREQAQRLEEMVEERTRELREAQEETAHGHSLLLALSQAAQAVQRARTPEEVYRTIGDEVNNLGYHALLFTLSDGRTRLALVYHTFNPSLLRAAEALAGLSARDFRPRIVSDGYHHQVIVEGQTVFFDHMIKPMSRSLGKVKRALLMRITQMLGIEQGIYAPLRVGDETQGILVVAGAGLAESDAPAVTVFANQAAIALQNARATEALRKSRRWLSTTLRSIGDAVIATDAQGVVTFMNPVAEELTGWVETQAVGQPLEEVFHIVNERTGEPVESPVTRVLREGAVVGLANHTLLIARDGARRPISDSGAPMEDEEGNAIGAVIVFRDITERIRSERERARAEEELGIKDNAIASSINAIAISDLQGNLTYINPAFLEMWGYEDERDVLGRSALEFWQQTQKAAELMRLVQEGEGGVGELVGLRKDGSLFDVQLYSSLVTNEAGEPLCMMGSFVDITERKETERALERRVNELKALNSMAAIVNQSLDMDEILERAMDEVLRRVGVEAAAIMLLDPSTGSAPAPSTSYRGEPVETSGQGEAGELALVAHRGLSDEFVRAFRRMKLGQGLAGRVAETGKPSVLQNLAEYPEALRSYVEAEKIRSAASVPLVGRAGVIGVMNLGAPSPAYFDAEGVELLLGLGQQLAIGLERGRLYEAARESEERFRRLSRAASEGIMIHEQGRILEANQTFAEMFGYEVSELVEMDGLDLIAPEYRELVREHIASGYEEPYEALVMRKNGTVFPADIIGKAIPYRGRTLRVVVVRDVTQRKRAEEAQRESETRYRNLTESLDQLIYRADPETFAATFVNSAVERIYGYTVEEWLADPTLWERTIHPDDRGRVFAEFTEAQNTFEPCVIQYRILRKDQAIRWVEDHVIWEKDEQGNVVSMNGVMYDVTERKEMQERLVRQERLAVLGKLAGGVGHELRNPLGAIKNAAYFLQMVLAERGLDPEMEEALEILEREVNRSERIVGDLLDFARARPPARRKADVNEVIQAALSRAKIPEGVEVVRQLDEDLPSVLADPAQLEQVFGNLMRNAVQAMPDGGRLVVQTEREDWEWLAVSIADTGVGIPEENLEKIFEPLFTTRAKGIGLGLAIVKTLVEGHGGAIEVESEVGKGSTFTLRLPVK